ncbi:hypothetical protein C3Y89_14245 [Rhizobium sp. UPM1132]|nr:hypothetical protein [Rhizobium ruizarguesonis]NKQ77918.1 hypothetical protein [Rhizobium ruizarguesonis]
MTLGLLTVNILVTVQEAFRATITSTAVFEQGVTTTPKITTGLNDRQKDPTIAQSGPVLPHDSGAPIEVTDEGVEKLRQKLEDVTRR